MPYYKKLVGQKCYLSPCAMGDAERWAVWDNDLAVALPLGDEAYTLTTLESTRQSLDEIGRSHGHIFSIVDLATDRLLGRCLLFNMDPVNRSAMVGIVIGEKEYWNQGYGQDAMRLLLDYGFNLLNLNSIMLGVFAFNERAIASYRKVGFKEIGRRRQARIVAGRKYDVVLMDILAEEFESVYVQQFVTQ
jgi:RimJ/RimL family protein N-acetyltransferase